MRFSNLLTNRTVRRPTALGTAAAVCVAALFAVASGNMLATPPAYAQGKPPPHAIWPKPPPHVDAAKKRPLVIRDQGAYAFAGTILGDFATESIHCDHGYVEFQIPVKARKLPLLMIHSSSTKTWETTFAGRDGFKNIFLRRGFSVYIVDQPRVGRAGWGCAEWTYTPDIGRDQTQFVSWRLGIWIPPDPPEFYPNVQFPTDDPDALDQLFRGRYPEFGGPENAQLEADAFATLLDEIGPAVLLTHSGSGIRGWWTAVKSENVEGIVAYEPSSFLFPEGEVPPPILRADGELVSPPGTEGSEIPLSDFLKLTEIPIQIVVGDNIPSELDPVNVGPRLALDTRRITVMRSQQFVDAINAHGGDAELLILPDVGVFGNTHFIMSDLNNAETADLLSEFLREKGLDTRW